MYNEATKNVTRNYFISINIFELILSKVIPSLDNGNRTVYSISLDLVTKII